MADIFMKYEVREVMVTKVTFHLEEDLAGLDSVTSMSGKVFGALVLRSWRIPSRNVLVEVEMRVRE
jgi:hypothetical protein